MASLSIPLDRKVDKIRLLSALRSLTSGLQMARDDLTFIIIYIQKFLDSDWLRVMQFLGNTMQK